VYLGNHELVTGNTARKVQAVADQANPGMTKLTFVVDNADVATTTGELRGLYDARDKDLPNLLAKLDTLAAGLIGSVNTLHVAGYGADNPPSTGLPFFTGTNASDIALNAVLAANPQAIAAASGPNLPGDGTNALAIADLQLAPNMVAGTAATNLIVGEQVAAGPVTVDGVTIGSVLTPGTYFMTVSGGNLDLHYGSAAGPVVGTAALADILTGTGTISFTSGPNTVATIRVQNTGALPFTIAQQQAAFTTAGNDTIQIEQSPEPYYANIVSVLGADANGAKGLADSSELLTSHLDAMRQSVSGVNLDEEMTNLNASQHAYNAAARVITTIDDMLDTLINRTGVTR
jgi:flagellar hook-associated protein 1 FlgK